MNSSTAKSIKVLVVEDSRVVSEFLTHVLNEDPRIEVVGVATNGREALEVTQRIKPDVITMDIHMPQMNGFEATRNIMEICPTPIVIVSGSSSLDEVALNFHAVEAGALAVLRRPAGIGHPNHGGTTKELVDTVKLMSEVKVVRRWNRIRSTPPSPALEASKKVIPASFPIHAIAIGASTGGPLAIQTILAHLPKNLSVPIVAVQHMTPGFTDGFVEWLTRSSAFPVRVGLHHETLLPGHVYMAPDHSHMGIGEGGRIILSKTERENGMKPSVSYLFRSLREAFGKNCLAILLTGMGADGVDELKRLRNDGAITIAQDEESSVIHGMPGRAIDEGAAMYVLPLDQIAGAIKTIAIKP